MMRDGVPVPEPSIGLGMAAAVDALLAAPMPLLSSFGSPQQYAAASAELDAAVRHYRDAGWLDARSCGTDVRTRRTTLQSKRVRPSWKSPASTVGGDPRRANPAASAG